METENTLQMETDDTTPEERRSVPSKMGKAIYGAMMESEIRVSDNDIAGIVASARQIVTAERTKLIPKTS